MLENIIVMAWALHVYNSYGQYRPQQPIGQNKRGIYHESQNLFSRQ
jgi:hypothetical protein